jgi:hypothetical protein
MEGSFVPHLRGTPKLRWFTCTQCQDEYDVPSIIFEDEWQVFMDKISALKTFATLQQPNFNKKKRYNNW